MIEPRRRTHLALLARVACSAGESPPTVKGGVTPEDKAAALKEGEITYDTAAAIGHANRVKSVCKEQSGMAKYNTP